MLMKVRAHDPLIYWRGPTGGTRPRHVIDMGSHFWVGNKQCVYKMKETHNEH